MVLAHWPHMSCISGSIAVSHRGAREPLATVSLAAAAFPTASPQVGSYIRVSACWGFLYSSRHQGSIPLLTLIHFPRGAYTNEPFVRLFVLVSAALCAC